VNKEKTESSLFENIVLAAGETTKLKCYIDLSASNSCFVMMTVAEVNGIKPVTMVEQEIFGDRVDVTVKNINTERYCGDITIHLTPAPEYL